MGLDTASLWDSTVASRERNKVAAVKLEQYFDRLVTGKSRLRPLPSALATLLRDRSELPDLRCRVSTVPSSWRKPSAARQTPTKAAARSAGAGPGPDPGRRAGLAGKSAPQTTGNCAGARRTRQRGAKPGPMTMKQDCRRLWSARAPCSGSCRRARWPGPLGWLSDSDYHGRSSGHDRRPRDTTFVVDRVLAVVGNRPVLASQVDEEIFSRQSQGAKLPTDPGDLQSVRQQIVCSIIDEELLVQQAQRDTSIKVTDEEIASGVEEQVRRSATNFTSEVDYGPS